MRVAIAEIQVGERRREDMGDIEGLARSLERYGQLQPIVIDEENRLLAGGRRLAAAKHLGWTHLEAWFYSALSDAERREIELEENLQRKDLTPHERSKVMVDLKETAKEAAREEETRPDTGQVSRKPKRGPPPTPGSSRDVEQRTGIDRATMQLAEQHVEAVKRYPVLGGAEVSQKQALELAGLLDAFLAGEGEVLLDVLQEMGLPWKKLAEAVVRVAAWSPEQRQDVYALARAATQRERSRAITLVTASGPSPDPQLGRVQEMRGLLQKAVKCAMACLKGYPADPWADDLGDMVTHLRRMDAQLIGIETRMQEASRRAYDAAVSGA